ncbi:MAG: hypothetical protein D6800_08505 [Candidatus Zixiibacteriota bacterium]|nr:MAG: hypothetical protein D6800_08505 [candidate division Zixibacteria bacterium]
MSVKALALSAIDRLNLYPLFHRYTRDTATVFMLHNFSPSEQPRPDTLTPAILDNFFSYLQKKQYTVLSLSDFVDALRDHESLYKTVVFTVDDGFRDFYVHAFPVFKQYGYGATVFLTSDFIEGKLFFWWNQIEYAFMTTSHREITVDAAEIGHVSWRNEDDRRRVISLVTERFKRIPNERKLAAIEQLVRRLEVDISEQPTGVYAPLSWDEIKEMQAGGIDFHPHTKTHPILTQIHTEQKRLEAAESKRVLEERLGGCRDIFCYPNGGAEDFDDEMIRILKETGYRAAVTGLPGFDSTRGMTDLFRLRRFAIPESLPVFKEYVSGLERAKTNLLRRS